MKRISDYFRKPQNDPKTPEPGNQRLQVNVPVPPRPKHFAVFDKPEMPVQVVSTIGIVPKDDGPDSLTNTKGKIHTRYSHDQKRKVVEYARLNGINVASRHFSVPRKNVYRWMRTDFSVKPISTTGNKPGQGRKLSYPTYIDDTLVQWILELRESHLPVTVQALQLRAVSLIQPHDPKFKASRGWVEKFMLRNNLSLRMRTSLAQKLPRDLEDKISSFHKFTQEIRRKSKFSLDFIANMDETPLYFDLVPGTTIDKKGVKSVRVRTTGSEKRHVTVTLCVTADGQCLPAHVIFKGVRELKLNMPKNVIVSVQEKGWMDKEKMKIWTRKIWRQYTKGNDAMLVLDSFRAHISEDAKSDFRQAKTVPVVIPGGCTSKLQPLDVSINKPFKALIRDKWVSYISNFDYDTVKIKPPTKQMLINWISEAWSDISERQDMIKKSFLVTGISNSLDGSQDAYYRSDSELSPDMCSDDDDDFIEDDDAIREFAVNFFSDDLPDDYEFHGFSRSDLS